MVLCRSVWVSDCLSFFLVPSQNSNMPIYPQSVVSQRVCPNSLLFRCFHFRFTFESIKKLGSTSFTHFHYSSCCKLLHTRNRNDGFFVVCTKPNWTFENIYVLNMALPKTPNYVVMLKKLKKDLLTPPHPFLTKCKRKEKKLSTQQRVNFSSFMFAITKATMNLWHSNLHLRQTNLWTTRKTKKPSF